MPTPPRVQQLIDAMQANPNKVREYASALLAITGHAPLADRAQMRQRINEGHHPPALVPVVQPMLAPSRWIEVAGIPVLAPQGEWLAGRIQFQFSPGFLVGMRGTAVHEKYEDKLLTAWDSGLGDFRAAGMRLQFNGGEPLITTGDAETWFWYSDAFGQSHEIAPLLRRVEASDTLNVQLRNDYPAALFNLILSLAFLFVADRDLPETLSAIDSAPAE